MNSLITESIRQVTPDRWILGSLAVCERVTPILEDVLASGNDSEDDIFCIRPIRESDVSTGPAPDPIHTGGTSAAVWALGGAIIKVKAWVEGIESEAETLRYVRQRSDVPAPEVIHHWVDEALNRSFLVLRPVRGKTLQQAWDSLSQDACRRVAGQVARYCEVLAGASSDHLERVTGVGIREPYLSPNPPDSAPSWRPIPFPRLTQQQAATYLQPMETRSKFHFYHADLSPTNIMVSTDGNVTSILDWESAGFFPRMWIATKPRVCYAFILEYVEGDVWAWRKLLLKALAERRYLPDVEGYRGFYERKKRCRAGEGCSPLPGGGGGAAGQVRERCACQVKKN